MFTYKQALKLVPDPIFPEVGRTPTLRNRIKFPNTYTYPYNLLTLTIFRPRDKPRKGFRN